MVTMIPVFKDSFEQDLSKMVQPIALLFNLVCEQQTQGTPNNTF
jgi:hypothetical protein